MKGRRLSRFSSRVYSLLEKVPKGKVTTYKEIAKALNTKAYRAVGTAVRKNPFAKVPCHRVVKSNAEVGNYTYKGKNSPRKKIEILRKEGVKIKNKKIQDFEKIMYRF